MQSRNCAGRHRSLDDVRVEPPGCSTFICCSALLSVSSESERRRDILHLNTVYQNVHPFDFQPIDQHVTSNKSTVLEISNDDDCIMQENACVLPNGSHINTWVITKCISAAPNNEHASTARWALSPAANSWSSWRTPSNLPRTALREVYPQRPSCVTQLLQFSWPFVNLELLQY